jgi:hypothetical protein
MNAGWIITTLVIIDTLMERWDHPSHPLVQAPDAAIVSVAVVAATFFQNHSVLTGLLKKWSNFSQIVAIYSFT